MRLLCFAKSKGNAPSTRQRVLGLMDVARSCGWETKLIFVPALPRWNFLPSRLFRFLKHWFFLRFTSKDTIIFLQRTLRCPEFLWLLRRYRTRFSYVISDIDDAVWVHSKNDVQLLLSLSDEVWCGSRVALSYVKAEKASAIFVPTTIDTSRFSLPRKEEEIPVVGWVGDVEAHKENLFLLASLLNDPSSLPPFRLRLIGISRFHTELRAAFSSLGDRLDLVSSVPYTDIPMHISRFSIGIMPLKDTAFMRGKSALKLVEYLAAGVPVVASDVGENAHLVCAPSHGFLATDSNSWHKTLGILLSRADLRECMGKAGQAFVRTHYDRKTVYEPLLNALHVD